MHDVKHACVIITYSLVLLRTLGSREKPTARAPAYSAESALLLAARAVPSAPPLSTTAVAAVLKETQPTLLFFLSALVLVNFLGMA